MTETVTDPARPMRRPAITSMEVLFVILVLAIVGQGWLQGLLDEPRLRTGATVFVAICVQALPFLVVGVLISGAIAAFVPARALDKVLPRREGLAVGAAGLAGIGLPTCECAAIPVARRLIGQGVAPAAALTFMNAAPAINPVVLVATAVAFPGEPGMVLARFIGSFATALVLGWMWIRWGKAEWIAERALRKLPDLTPGNRWRVFTETARGDLVDAGGFLVIGAMIAAAMNVLVPGAWFATIGGQLVFGILVMAVLAVLLSLCSEADAFVVASIPGIPLLAKLVFLVVGPVVDAKLIMLYAGSFGRTFAVRFAPAAFVIAIACAIGAGLVVLGGAR